MLALAHEAVTVLAFEACDGAGYNAVISCREREPAPVPAHEVEMPPDITCNIVPVPPIDSIIRGSGK